MTTGTSLRKILSVEQLPILEQPQRRCDRPPALQSLDAASRRVGPWTIRPLHRTGEVRAPEVQLPQPQIPPWLDTVVTTGRCPDADRDRSADATEERRRCSSARRDLTVDERRSTSPLQ